MQEVANLRRNEEGVSAAIATVLLFAGVLSLIGMMLITMLPVIQELEGSVERNGMLTQMNEYASRTVILAESGMPGDAAKVDLEPLDGQMNWDYTRGGSWLSATWTEEQSFRMRNVMDLDRDAEIRYPHGEIGSICWDDLRLGPERTHYTRLPDIPGTVIVTPKIGIAEGIAPIELTMKQGGSLIRGTIDGVSIWSSDIPLAGESGDVWVEASNQVDVYIIRGDGGSTLVPPSHPDPITSEGRSWTVPLSAGTTELHLVSQETVRVDWQSGTNTGSEISTAGGGFYEEGTTWTKAFSVDSPSIVSLTSSSDARLLITNSQSGSGDAPWPATTGAMVGKQFLPPANDGVLLFDNPTSDAVIVRYLGGSLSVPANDSLRIDWPPSNAVDSPLITSDSPVQLHWMKRNSETGLDRSGSLAIYAAMDTGRISGKQFNFSTPTSSGSTVSTKIVTQVAGVESSWNITTWNLSTTSNHSDTSVTITPPNSEIYSMNVVSGDSVRIIVSSGDDGLAHFPSDGSERCYVIDTQASGWITTSIPWKSTSNLDDPGKELAWRYGEHPSSMTIRIYANDAENPHHALATAWAFHMPSLTYTFESSITGMETSTRGGAVMTNHPEMQSTVIRAPSDRAGPGPRFAATVPMAFPTSDSVSGSADVEVGLRLMHRQQLTSSLANEVRRGWDGPYGSALAGLASQDLSYSTDWTTFPQQLQLLNDYKGWVPDPAPDSSETVYHTQGEQIQFTLQVSIIHHTAKEA